MTKYQCTRCDAYDPCFYDSGKAGSEPIRCPLVEGNKPHWEPIRNEDYGKPPIPDWIKVGALVYFWDDAVYAEITKIETVDCSAPIIHFNNDTSRIYGSLSWDDVSQARQRPYNAEEMRGLVGKVLKHDTGCYLVTGFENRWNQVKIESVWRDADELMKLWTWLDGTPCSVLEYLHEEKGEWVK